MLNIFAKSPNWDDYSPFDLMTFKMSYWFKEVDGESLLIWKKHGEGDPADQNTPVHTPVK